jgi:hypothetical protein
MYFILNNRVIKGLVTQNTNSRDELVATNSRGGERFW